MSLLTENTTKLAGKTGANRKTNTCVLFEDSDLTLSNKIPAKEATKKSHTRVTRRCVSLYTKVPSSYCY